MAAAAAATTPVPEEGRDGEIVAPAAPEATAGETSGEAEQGTGDSEAG